jgi:hypothetical protein
MNLSSTSPSGRSIRRMRGLHLHTPMPPEVDPESPPPPAIDPDLVPDDDPVGNPTHAPDGDPPVKPPPVRGTDRAGSPNVAGAR